MTGRQDVTVVLVRHGETEWNCTGRVQGWAQVPLTDRGREQARALGGHLASAYDFDRVVASDLRRARETAVRLHGQGVDPAPVYSRRWRERHFGVLQGLTGEELFGEYPEFRTSMGATGARSVPEGGESLVGLRTRVLDAWQTLLADAGDDTDADTVLVVTHSGPIYAVLGHVRRMDLPSAFAEHSQDNCAVTELHVADENPGDVRIVRENERVDEE